jgi:hypothetical protein
LAILPPSTAIPRGSRRLRHDARPQLLAIDAVGYLSCSNRHADLMFDLIS